ncbi:hypothetical protein SAY86_017815 [Trapa natans]|uniref:Uncharacterized protein n=1 Tax=Trapa natans TaxID=22666 RepID=A0AAN7LQ68_TRANT|nr:hypothetical protein SAY86_017815 [Trapa natans]
MAVDPEKDIAWLVDVTGEDPNANPQINCPCFQILNPCFDEVSQHYSVGVLPEFLKDGSPPLRLNCPFHNSHGQDVYSISLLPEEDGMDAGCVSPLAVLSLLDVEDPIKDQMSSNAQLDCKDFVDFEVEKLDACSPCVVDVDIEKENYEMVISNYEKHGNNEGLLSNMNRALRRQVSLKTGQKLMRLLMDNSIMLLKFVSKEKPVTERVMDASNKWRRYRRAAYFDSRKIVILFSILSSLGTLVLIYLTLRVRQSGDASMRSW